MMFRDQVGVLAGWFKGWNECEQTVALLSLLKRVSQTQARFLQLCLEHSLADCAELHVLEGEANSPGKCVAVAPREPRLPASLPGPAPGLHSAGTSSLLAPGALGIYLGPCSSSPLLSALGFCPL